MSEKLETGNVKELVRAEEVATTVRTLIGNGFVLEKVLRKPNYLMYVCHRYDEFGVQFRYIVVLCQDILGRSSAAAVKKYAEGQSASVVVVGGGAPEDLICVSWETFLSRLGGPVKSWLPLDPGFSARLVALGHNQPVEGVPGRPDDLFEEYVHVGLQYLLANRVIRYGQDRRFEVLPDGIGFAGSQSSVFLYDAKAYKDGYPVTRGSIRQFSDYITKFHQRYERLIGRVHVFLAVSGHFANDRKSREERANELYSECGVRLAFLTAVDLGASVAILAAHPAYRTVLDWRAILARTDITSIDIQAAVDSAYKDKLVRP